MTLTSVRYTIYYINTHISYVLKITNNFYMKVTYDELTKNYIATDGELYAIGQTMLEAIQRVLSIKLYNLTNK